MVTIHRDECCVKKGYCFMPLEDKVAVLEAVNYPTRNGWGSSCEIKIKIIDLMRNTVSLMC